MKNLLLAVMTFAAFSQDSAIDQTNASAPPSLEAIRPGDDSCRFRIASEVVERSTDSGGTWHEVAKLPGKSPVSLAVKSQDEAYILLDDGHVVKVDESGVADLGPFLNASHLENVGDDVCVKVDSGESMCLGRTEKQGHDLRLASVCRYTVTPSSINLPAQWGGSVSVSVRPGSGCSTGRLIVSGGFLALSTFSISGLSSFRVSAGPTTIARGGAVAIVGTDGKIATVIPVQQVPLGRQVLVMSPVLHSVVNTVQSVQSRATSGVISSVSNPASAWISVRASASNASFTVFTNGGTARLTTISFIAPTGARGWVSIAQDGR